MHLKYREEKKQGYSRGVRGNNNTRRDTDLTDQGTVLQQPSRAKLVIVTGAVTHKKKASDKAG